MQAIRSLMAHIVLYHGLVPFFITSQDVSGLDIFLGSEYY